jgi:hypothetical protein
MDAGEQRFAYTARPTSQERTDLTILLGAACLALAALFALCALAAPKEPVDPEYSVTVASSFG